MAWSQKNVFNNSFIILWYQLYYCHISCKFFCFKICNNFFFHFLCDKLEVVVIMGSIIELWVNHYLQSKENGCGKPMYLCKLVWIKKMMDLISVYSIINITSGISAMMDLRSLILKFHFPNVTSPLNYPSPINFWVIFFSWNPWSFQRNKAHKEQVFPFAQSISTNSPILYYLCLANKLMHA